jgi:Baseplate J-like protein
MIYQCCNENRKAALLGNPILNGIDYLEVLDHDAIPLDSPRQRTLLVHCLNKVPSDLAPGNVLITGGESITGITAQWIGVASASPTQATAKESAYLTGLADAAKVLVIRTSAAGDFSPYTLRLVNSATEATEDSFEVTEALTGFDPELAEVEFAFKVECGPDFDCAPPPVDCPPELPDPPPINYLAKDYGSFRSIMLDRLNQLVPSWGGRSEADIGVALTELIAYVGDQLSYQQDAVATEAYLETARSRISLRRHARLVDYFVHDGCNARAWLVLQVSTQVFLDHTTTRFYTDAPGMPSTLAIGAGNEEPALLAGVIVYEPMQDAVLYPELNQISFYTWGDTNCCLARGATEATLRGSLPSLQPGDVLILQEMMGPQTGNPADAEIRHRCAVRLTAVTTQDAQGLPLVDPLFEDGSGDPVVSVSQAPTLVTEIQWSTADALPFPVCISSTFVNSKGDRQTLTDVSVAFGNVVLADQGLTFSGVPMGTVPDPSLFKPPNPAGDRCNPAAPVPFPVRFSPVIQERPLTQAVPLPLAGSPVTPGIVSLLPNRYVSLKDANGFISLMVGAAQPYLWPQHFGIVVTANTVNPANFDLSVIFKAAGATLPIYLETFSGLSVTTAGANNAVTQLNSLSKFVRVPSTYSPPATGPTAFPLAPTMLANSGPTNLVDATASTYLVVEPTNTATWPPNFGVLAQGNQKQPSVFNLLVVYDPPSGGNGVKIPVVVEQFDDLSLGNVTQTIGANSQLITAKSFDEQPNASLSAYELMHFNADEAVAEITLSGVHNEITTTWTPELDLLGDSATDTHFAVEVESDGSAHLRFGDDTNGRRPESGTMFTASYRIGSGTAGNVGAGSLIHLAADPRIQSCINPLPATGGTDPETADQIRRRAPQAFMTQERAITMADYAAIAERNSQVDEAVATLRWTGSWYTVFVTAEPKCTSNLTASLRKALTRSVNRYRLAGQDIQLKSPEYLSLEIELTVCVNPGYFRSQVEEALLEVLGSKVLRNGQKGVFHPDYFTFGQTVYLSRLYAAARKVAGVDSITATIFEPQGIKTKRYLVAGEIPVEPLQIARLENDRSLPDHGRLNLVMRGGK